MKSKTLGFLNNATSALKQIQSVCIGVYKPYASKVTELVLEDNGDFLVTVSVGTLLGVTTSYNSPKNKGSYVPFPEGKTQLEMMEDPMKFHVWYKENVNF